MEQLAEAALTGSSEGSAQSGQVEDKIAALVKQVGYLKMSLDQAAQRCRAPAHPLRTCLCEQRLHEQEFTYLNNPSS